MRDSDREREGVEGRRQGGVKEVESEREEESEREREKERERE